MRGLKRGPAAGKSNTDFVAKARAAWGDKLPEWVLVVAEEAARTSQVDAAKKIGVSPSLLSYVIGNKYPGDIERVEQVVRGALMGLVVACPVLGEIGRDQCLGEQRKTFAGTSSIRARLYRHCRGNGAPLCTHSRLKKPE